MTRALVLVLALAAVAPVFTFDAASGAYVRTSRPAPPRPSGRGVHLPAKAPA